MNDALQVLLVSLAALVALGVIVRPYLRKSSSGTSSPPCANCSVGTARRQTGAAGAVHVRFRSR